MTRLLLFATCIALTLTSADPFGVSVHGERRYYCRDKYGYIGDCYDKYYSVEHGYGYHNGDRGKYVGNGYYNLVSGRHAELVCDFNRDGGIRDDVFNIAWRKVDNYGYNQHSDLRHGRSSNYNNWYSSNDFRCSSRVHTQNSKSTLYIRDYRYSDQGRYRCTGTRSSHGYGRYQTVYMDVEFYPHRRN